MITPMKLIRLSVLFGGQQRQHHADQRQRQRQHHRQRRGEAAELHHQDQVHQRHAHDQRNAHLRNTSCWSREAPASSSP
jgi:hypothetical protein